MKKIYFALLLSTSLAYTAFTEESVRLPQSVEEKVKAHQEANLKYILEELNPRQDAEKIIVKAGLGAFSSDGKVIAAKEGFTKEDIKLLHKEVVDLVKDFNKKVIVPPVLTDPVKQVSELLGSTKDFVEAINKLGKIYDDAHAYHKFVQKAKKIDQTIEAATVPAKDAPINHEAFLGGVPVKFNAASSPDPKVKALAQSTESGMVLLKPIDFKGSIPVVIKAKTYNYTRDKKSFTQRNISTVYFKFFTSQARRPLLDKLSGGQYEYWEISANCLLAIPKEGHGEVLTITSNAWPLLGLEQQLINEIYFGNRKIE